MLGKLACAASLQKGTGSKVEGFRLARENEVAGPRIGKVRTCPTQTMTRMNITRWEAAALRNLLSVVI